MVQKVLVELQVTALMHGKNNGFSLLELLVVMFLIGIMTTFALQVYKNVRPAYKQEQFVDNVRTLLAIAWQGALTTGKIHRLYFDLTKRVMLVEKQTNEPYEEKEVFAPVARAFDQAQFKWPSAIVFKQFYIQGVESMYVPGIKTNAIWFYIMPDGMVQEIIMNIEETVDDSKLPLSIVINPFTAQLSTYDTFQKP